MRKSTLILAIAPLIFMLGACNNESGKTKAPTNTASSTEAPLRGIHLILLILLKNVAN